MPKANEREHKRKSEEKLRDGKLRHEKLRAREEEKRRQSQLLKSDCCVLRIEIPKAEPENSNSQLAADATTMKKVNATSQPMAVEKLQENAGVIPKTATPATLFLILGLALLTLAWYFRVPRAEA